MLFFLAFIAPPLVGAFAMGMDALERRAAKAPTVASAPGQVVSIAGPLPASGAAAWRTAA